MSAEISARTVLPKRCPKCNERFPADFRVCPRDAVGLEEVDATVDDPYIGATLQSTYRIDSLIAEGGMGRVYEARHLRLPGRTIAVKILHRALLGDGELVGRFKREAEIAGAIAHPNVVQIIDVHATADGVPFIVAERLVGEDLGQRLDRVGRMSIADTVHILRQACSVLAAVHGRGVVHRDLKPNNLFLVGDMNHPTVKLIDFGIAKLRGPGDATMTRTGVVMGTPAFMAPEQARGANVDARADIYAIGAIAYRCVTGRAPYDSEDSAAALHAVLTEEPPRPRAVEPSIPEDFEMVLQRAMARDPGERYESLAALDAALTAFVAPGAESSSMLAPKVAASTELAAVARRARPTIAAMSGVGFAILAGGLAEALAAVFMASAVGGGALAVIASLAALATPGYLYVRYLQHKVWHNSPKAVAWARWLTLVVGAGAAMFATMHLLGRLLDLLFADGAGPGGFGRVAPWVLGLAAAGAAWLYRRDDRVVRVDGAV
ncbi:MAG: serine/threonine protein kinase [Myxococcales bacterium]|nr:serine/threonine protein kinase [Myxococcales bacterium]